MRLRTLHIEGYELVGSITAESDDGYPEGVVLADDGSPLDGTYHCETYWRRHTARIVVHDEDFGTARGHIYRTCSRCHTRLGRYGRYDFCPSCGARLVVPDDSRA